MPKCKGGVRKECESCDQQIPVACKTCPECSHELIPEKDKKEEGSPDTSEVDSNTDQVERRRSVRAKRDKPDYYDALDYESKRQKTPKSEKKRGSGYPLRSPSAAASAGTKMRRFPGAQQQHSRATLTWKKGSAIARDEEEATETVHKKKGKRTAGGHPPPPRKEEVEEAAEPTLDDIPPDKTFACAVTLAEINRKLGVVMWKPV